MAGRPDHSLAPLRRAAPFLLLLVFATAMFAMALMISGKGLRSLDVTCNFRLLDSVRSWLDHGFWELGGLLSFRDAREALPGLPDSLYKSQGTLYMIPHALAHAVWGESGFWTMVRVSTIAYAALTSLGVSCIAGLLVEERQVVGASRRLVPLVMLVAALAAIPQKGIWGALWNVDDRALSAALVTAAATAAGLAIRLDRRWFNHVAAGLLVLASLGCPRMGVMLAITIGAFSALGPPSTLLRLRLAVLCFSASVLHYLRVLVVDSWGLFHLKGSGPLLRFGLPMKWRSGASPNSPTTIFCKPSASPGGSPSGPLIAFHSPQTFSTLRSMAWRRRVWFCCWANQRGIVRATNRFWFCWWRRL